MQGGLGSARARRTLEALREKITSGEWPINAKIPPEPALVDLLGVGRTTVREAVRSLATLGMLETLPGIGTFVRSRTPVSTLLAEWIADFDIAEILGYRRALEVEASQLAAAHRTDADLAALRAALAADEAGTADFPARAARLPEVERGRTPGQFHTLIFEASRNRLLLNLYTGTLAALRAAADAGLVGYGATDAVRQADHAQILAAIEAGDVMAAAHAMSAHTEHGMVPVEQLAVAAGGGAIGRAAVRTSSASRTSGASPAASGRGRSPATRAAASRG